jgi:site-specific recombinase XerD
MAKSFSKLTRPTIRKTMSGDKIIEHGIIFERLIDGDGRYSVNIMVDGQRIHRVIGKESDGVTRQQAEDFISQARTDARKGRLNLPSRRKTVLGLKEAVSKYLLKLEEIGGKDLKKKESRFSLHLTPFFNDKPLPNITTFDIERYKKYRQSESASPGTINRELAALSHLFNMAIEWKWINHRPAQIKRFKEDSGRIRYLTQEQCLHLIQTAKSNQNPDVYPFIVVGLGTSMRRMEILSMKLENIDTAKRIIYIPKAKAGAREQPITDSLAKFLQGYIDNADGQRWLFPSKRSVTGHTVSIEKAFRNVVIEAGFDPAEVVRHTLRHTAITHLVQAGVDLPTVQRISGHKTLEMVVRYSHQNGKHINAAMDKLENRYQTSRRELNE